MFRALSDLFLRFTLSYDLGDCKNLTIRLVEELRVVTVETIRWLSRKFPRQATHPLDLLLVELASLIGLLCYGVIDWIIWTLLHLSSHTVG